ncbi:MAG: hypothetical protein Q9216_006757 [Gyalolechia sp. 2 TL-2023]
MSSTVQWQVDLPGLSSLVMNLGAAGLKQLAQAGVDIHTLICMAEIAETCPASLEYRREISRCRQKQRKQSICFYKVVEIGTDTNFIADELLKKRAGENIVALMSTVLPILSEDDCDSFILKLFENYQVPADNTPGLGQLQAFRDALLSLAQGLDFKDRTFHYHHLINRLRAQGQQPLNISIPNVEILVRAITMLQKIVLDADARYALTYRGWAGAAWVITYARHVLGLPVCVLRTARDSVPINGHYQNSKVFVYIFEQESSCELVLDGKVSDLVAPTASIEHIAWVIDVKNVNLRDTFIPINASMREAASVIVRSLALFFAARRAMRFEHVDSSATPRLIPYTVSCLPSIRRRTLSIVDRIGFRIRADIDPDADTWQEYFSSLEDWDTSEQGFNFRPSPMWLHTFSPHKDRSSGVPSRSQYPGFDNQDRLLLEPMFRLADAAACLAFSDWGEHINLISIAFIQDGLPELRSSYDLAFAAVSSQEEDCTRGECFLELEWTYETHDVLDLTESLISIVLGRKVYYNPFVIFLECQDVVFARAAAAEDSLDLHAKLIQIYPGHIMMLGQRRMEIRISTDPVSQDKRRIAESTKQLGPEYCPYDGLGEVGIKTMSRLTRNGIEIQRSLAILDEVYELNCPTLSSDEILGLYITNECSHSYYSRAMGLALNPRFGVLCGFRVGEQAAMNQHIRGKWTVAILLQTVDQNPCGQWASVHSGEERAGREVRILQHNMCTRCVVDLITHHYERIGSDKNIHLYTVIPGRLPGEEMDETVTDTESPQSPMDTGTT